MEHPGRYLGGELEARPNEAPDANGRLLRVALAFADVYEIAHGHLGHKILYSLINERAGLSAERVYAPWPDWERVLREKSRLLESLESRRPLIDFDLVGFSLQYELGYTNILNMLEMGGIPILAADRTDSMPLVAAGGPGAYNPEPLADFFDIFFLGDAEHSFALDLEIIKEWKAEGTPKSALWERLAGREGIYIPSLFKPHYTAEGRFKSLEPLLQGYTKVRRAAVASLNSAPFPCQQITPLIKPVHDRVVVEIGRGCSRGCRFCQAGYIYRPVRERRQATIMDLAKKNLQSSGQDEVSFLSLSAGDHTEIAPLVSGFMDEYAAQTVALSLPSLRVKSLSGHLARQIRRVRKTGFTLAPDAGTQRLRQVINKHLTDDDLMAAAETACSLGWRSLKLYFMVGLPTETDDDLAGIADLTRRLKRASRVQLNLGVAHFTPKAHTPFQWHPASSAATISDRLFKVKDLTKAPGLAPKWNAPGASWVESILARGDRRLGPVLEKVFRAGARFEAWGDRFDPRLWVEALASENLAEEVLLNPFAPGDALPYGHLFAGVREKFLLDELDKAQRGETTPDCRWSDCHSCEACKGALIDLARRDPAPQSDGDMTATEATEVRSKRPAPPAREKNLPGAVYLVNFQKGGRAAYLGHLELVELFKRAFRRAGIRLNVTEGFHPQPKISFLTALPLGVTSEDEYVKVVAADFMSADELAARLAGQLPEDVKISGARMLPPHRAKVQPEAVVWQMTCGQAVFPLGAAPQMKALLVQPDKKGGSREYRLGEFITAAEATAENVALVTIKLGLDGTPKPWAAAEALWGLEAGSLSGVLRKMKTVLAE
ncbi:MAG: TIGR03960 family B12-binding radical SAM protein [Candidatus Adiutrix sp.]|nr:TIGR03960 family B12-binding radical SAM protein [Candidatus Adiutrix sp.]